MRQTGPATGPIPGFGDRFPIPWALVRLPGISSGPCSQRQGTRPLGRGAGYSSVVGSKPPGTFATPQLNIPNQIPSTYLSLQNEEAAQRGKVDAELVEQMSLMDKEVNEAKRCGWLCM